MIGVLVSATIEAFVPENAFTALEAYGGLAAMLVTLLIALPLYVCATASVPIAAALVASGLPTGAALVFLMAGPATNVATLGAVYRTLGRRPLAVYLATVVIGSILCGWAFEFVIDARTTTPVHEHTTTTWWSIASAVILLALVGKFALQELLQSRKKSTEMKLSDRVPNVELAVSGMTCADCVAKLETTLSSDASVDAVTVTLENGRVTIYGQVSEARARQLVEQAGFWSA